MEKCAIAIKDEDDLFLFLTINRSKHGDVYINFNEHHPNHKPHSSYHSSGQLHHKSSKHYVFPIRKKQKPSINLKGSESIITTSIRKGDGKAWNIKCDPKDYSDIMIIPDEIIIPEFGFQFHIEVVEAGTQPWASTYPYIQIIQQKIFDKNIPWIAASLYEMHGTPVIKQKRFQITPSPFEDSGKEI